MVIAVGAAGAAFGANPSKLPGSLKFWDGVIYSEQDQITKKEISDSIDPVTGKSTKEFNIKSGQLSKDGSLEIDDKKNEKTIEFNMDGKELRLKFHYVLKSNKNIVLPNSEEGYQLSPIPNSDQYLIEYNGSLYQLDIKNSKITKVLSDQVDAFEYTTLKNKKVEDLPLAWGERPYYSPNGDYLIYYSNRNAVKNGGGNGQLWVKNFKNNNEKAVYDGGFEFAGWGESSQVFIRDNNKLVEINLEDSSNKVIQDNVALETLVVYPFVIAPELGNINITDMKTNETHSINEGVGRADMLLADPSGSHIAIKNYPDPNSFDTNILVLDDLKNAASFKKISPDDGYVIDSFSWVDSENLLVVVIKKGTIEQSSYLVNINELK